LYGVVLLGIFLLYFKVFPGKKQTLKEVSFFSTLAVARVVDVSINPCYSKKSKSTCFFNNIFGEEGNKMREKERIRIGVSKDDEFDLDFTDGKVPDVCDFVIGLHYVCGGFVTKVPTSRGANFILVCGKCGLRIEIPSRIMTKKSLVEFLVQRGFHQKGKEVKVCLDCEGRKWVRHTELKEETEWIDGRPITKNKEVVTTGDCPECKGTGLLLEAAGVA